MPRVKKLGTPDPRAVEIRKEIGGIMGVLRIGIPDLSRISGIPEMTLRRRMKEPGNFRQFEIWAIEDAAKRRGWKDDN